MKQRCSWICIAVLFVLVTPVVEADEQLAGELGTLTRAVTRLVETMAAQAGAREVDQDLSRLRIAVSVLDIRSQRLKAIRADQQILEEQEGSVTRYMATVEAKLANLSSMMQAATDDDVKRSLGIEREELRIDLESLKSRLEHTRGRYIEVQGRLIEQEELVEDLEHLIDSWLSTLRLDAEQPAKP